MQNIILGALQVAHRLWMSNRLTRIPIVCPQCHSTVSRSFRYVKHTCPRCGSRFEIRMHKYELVDVGVETLQNDTALIQSGTVLIQGHEMLAPSYPTTIQI